MDVCFIDQFFVSIINMICFTNKVFIYQLYLIKLGNIVKDEKPTDILQENTGRKHRHIYLKGERHDIFLVNNSGDIYNSCKSFLNIVYRTQVSHFIH